MASSQERAEVRDRHDRPLGCLRLSVTDRCNLRCSYCMPEESYRWLPRAELLDYDELSWLVDRFIAVGVRRVRITGGEPLLRRDLSQLIERLARKPALDDIALTSNGLLLGEQLEALREAGLGRLTVSLDTLRPERFLALTKRDALAQVLDAIRLAGEAGFRGSDATGQARLKLDTVMMRGENDDELAELVAFARQSGAELRFIEYMDVAGATQWRPERVLSRADMLAELTRTFGPIAPLPGRGSAPAERFRLPDGTVIGIIASTTTPFCGACDRSRVTADGMWLTCLYAPRGHDLKAPLRAGMGESAFEQLLAEGWGARNDRGAEQRLSAHKGLTEARAETLIPASALRKDPHLEMHTRGG